MTFKKILLTAGIIVAGTYSAVANDIILDNYIGDNNPGNGVSNQDVLYGWMHVDIYSMSVSRSDEGEMTVQIHTDIVNNIGRGHSGGGVQYGDLFMSVQSEDDALAGYGAWAPDTSQPNYRNDDFYNGNTTWEYAYDLNGARNNTSSGNITEDSRLVSLDNPSSAGNYVFGVYRDGEQVYRVNDSQTEDIGGGAVNVVRNNVQNDADNNYIQFVFDVSGTSLATADQIAFRWTSNLAKDVIEGAVDFVRTTVPEPAVLGLLLLGLAGFGYSRKSKIKTSY